MASKSSLRLLSLPLLLLHLICLAGTAVADPDYLDALNKSIIFYEGQRSGKLDLSAMRTTWRGDSALQDGIAQGVNLSGGYYDAGDNIKFGFPMAFSMSLLAYSILEYNSQLSAAGQLNYALTALQWGTDYFIKAHTAPNKLWGQVGNTTDHACWERPEDMETSRTAYFIDASNPGTELAAETAAALAAASIVFKSSNPAYSALCLTHATQLFTFADSYRGTYSTSIPAADAFYHSWSGYNDELAWAAAWLYRASGSSTYISYLLDEDVTLGQSSSRVAVFSWDLKTAGTQLLLTKLYLSGDYDTSNAALTSMLQNYKAGIDAYVCANVPSPTRTVKTTPQGLIYNGVVNSQYVMNAAFLVSVHSDYLAAAGSMLTCGTAVLSPATTFAFSKAQMDYILGVNSASTSYMVGFSPTYTQQAHHRGASNPSIHTHPIFTPCGQTYNLFYSSPNPNPNVHVGAIVGGPDASDKYSDLRSNDQQNEPTTYINAGAVGVLAKLYSLSSPSGQSNPPLAVASPPSVAIASPPSVAVASPPLVAVASPPPVAIPSPPPVAIASPPPVAVASPPLVAVARPPPVAIASPPPVTIASPPPVAVVRPPPVAVASSPPIAVASPPLVAIASPPPTVVAPSLPKPANLPPSPPPQVTSSPPPVPASSLPFTIVQTSNGNGDIPGTTQYSVTIAYTGTDSVTSLLLSSPQLAGATSYWNVQSSGPTSFTLPAWAYPLTADAAFSAFGYQIVGQADISVQAYTTSSGGSFQV